MNAAIVGFWFFLGCCVAAATVFLGLIALGWIVSVALPFIAECRVPSSVAEFDDDDKS